MTDPRAFEDWVAKAKEADIVSEAVARGAKLKRAGREMVGACPACGGTDRFAIHPAKRIFNCRGSVGGDVIKMAEHIDGASFLQAVEALTGEPSPGAQANPLSAAEQVQREKHRAETEARQRARDAEQAAYEEDTLDAAKAIWNACRPIKGTLAETYLASRGFIDLPSLPLSFHPALKYPGKGKMPALVCRADDLLGDFTGIWRIFLKPDGSGKADVPNAKLGLGPCGGGAVRIGGEQEKIGVCEGVETALGAWNLIGRKYPVWAALSTSGLIGIELPLEVRSVVIFPDGDRGLRRKGEEYITVKVPPGRLAAQTLATRLKGEGLRVTIAAEPNPGIDYCDIWNRARAEAA